MKLPVQKYSYLLSFLMFLSLVFTSFVFSSSALAAEKNGEAAIIKFSKDHQLVLTTMDGGVDRKTEAILELLKRAPEDKIIIIAFEPSDKGRNARRQLWANIYETVENVKKEKNVVVKLKYINHEIAYEGFKIAQEQHRLNQDQEAQAEADSLYIKEFDGLENTWLINDVPENYVLKLERSSYFSNLGATFVDLKDTITYESLRSFSFSGLVISTILTYAGAEVFTPTYVLYSDGEFSKETLIAFSITLGSFYLIPRYEKVIKALHEFAYQINRTGWNSIRWIGHKISSFAHDREFHLAKETDWGRGLSLVTSTMLGGFALQAASYSLLDGSQVFTDPDNIEFMIRNSLLLGAASTPWTFATDKIKEQTKLAESATIYTRTAQLALIGTWAAALPPTLETSLYTLSPNPAEAALVGMGVLGLAANKYAVKIINKAMTYNWFKELNKRLVAITTWPRRQLWNILGTATRNVKRNKRASMEASRSHNLCLEYLTSMQ